MSEHVIDTVLRIRVEHRPGQLARLTNTIAEAGGLIGDISTINVGETATLRDVTIETIDEEQTLRVVMCIGEIDGVEVMATTDRVFEAHRGGKLHSTSRVHLDQLADMRSIYTPGVARVSRAIVNDPSRAWDLTSIGNSVGIFTNGSRVLGLGNIGPLASMPVMEGKAVLYDELVDISATPVLIDTLKPMEFVDTVMRVSHTFGGIHLEDIRIPDCYVIEEELRRLLRKPVMHDDQHGTATVTLAAVINACRITNRDLKGSRVGMIGLGAAGSAIAKLAVSYGVGEVLVADTSADAVRRVAAAGAIASDMATIMAEADIVIAATGLPRSDRCARCAQRPGHLRAHESETGDLSLGRAFCRSRIRRRRTLHQQRARVSGTLPRRAAGAQQRDYDGDVDRRRGNDRVARRSRRRRPVMPRPRRASGRRKNGIRNRNPHWSRRHSRPVARATSEKGTNDEHCHAAVERKRIRTARHRRKRGRDGD